jgi:hypothetical protein
MDSQRCLKRIHHPSSEKPNPFLRVKREACAGGGETITYKAFPGTSQQVTFASDARFPIIIPAWHLPAAFVCDSSGASLLRVHRSPFSPQVTRRTTGALAELFTCFGRRKAALFDRSLRAKLSSAYARGKAPVCLKTPNQYISGR